MVGVSRDTRQFPNAVFRALRNDRRTLYPVNAHPDATTVEGQTCYHSLAEVPDPVDGVLVMVPAASALGVVRQAAERGVTRVWLHRGGGPGAVSDEAVAFCHEHGIEVVDGACPLMFSEPVRGVHRFHRLLSRRRITA